MAPRLPRALARPTGFLYPILLNERRIDENRDPG
ncbi:hypothetical protein SAMN05428968_1077 [Janthinobacterium sp. YR213]|nr:hypothetical protein SAMN05428968_1077 [Janthinobacterium sp. YR213]